MMKFSGRSPASLLPFITQTKVIRAILRACGQPSAPPERVAALRQVDLLDFDLQQSMNFTSHKRPPRGPSCDIAILHHEPSENLRLLEEIPALRRK